MSINCDKTIFTVFTTVFTVLALYFGFAFQVGAEEIARFDRKVVGFQDHAKPGSVLFVSEDGRADWYQGRNLERQTEYKVQNEKCKLESQDTSSMAQIGGMTLAYPFLVGLGRVCCLKESDHTVRLLMDFQHRLMIGSFSATYAGEIEDYSYFLINGRNTQQRGTPGLDEPDEPGGYLSLIEINKKEKLATWVQDFIAGLPGLSGAMVSDSDSVWITNALIDNPLTENLESGIFKIPFEKLHPQTRATTSSNFTPLDFTPLTREKVLTIADIQERSLSIFMLANQTSFLYYNYHKRVSNGVIKSSVVFPSFTVSKETGEIKEKSFNKGCIPVSGFENQWLVLCDGLVLEAME